MRALLFRDRMREESAKAAAAESADPWRLRLERVRGKVDFFDKLERISSQTLLELLEVPQHNRTAGRAAMSREVVQIEDAWTDPLYEQKAAVKISGGRSMIGVPLMREGEPIGVIGLARTRVEPFKQREIELVTTFADQAVIAIENARLLSELRQRTNDLTESLQQQTATSEILEVISNSPTDTQPAFDAIVRSGLKLFPNAVIAISLPDGDKVKMAAIDGADRADLEALRARYPLQLSREYITSTAILDQREMDFADAGTRQRNWSREDKISWPAATVPSR